MLLLNFFNINAKVFKSRISIHLMLLLNHICYNVISSLGVISIHLMLLLNVVASINISWISTNFNTSYVVIKPYCLFASIKLLTISIHLMLLLNPSKLATFHFLLYLKAYIYQQLSIFLPVKLYFY